MAGSMFLKLGDDPKFRGGCTAPGHAGWIELQHVSWGWHESRDPAGTRTPVPAATDVSVSTEEIVGTSALFRACLDDTIFPLVLVDLVPAGGPTLRFELRKATVPSMSTTPARDGKPNTQAMLKAERIGVASAAAAPAGRPAP